MNRRRFLAATAATTALASETSARARQTGRLKVIVPQLLPAEIEDLKLAAPQADLVVSRSEAEAIEQAPGAAACYGYISPGVVRAGKELRWVQQPRAGVESLMEIPELVHSDIVLTNMQRVYAPEIADQAIGYLLAFTRSLTHFIRAQPAQEWRSRQPGVVLEELMGKTMLIIGLGGIGSEIARRAHAFGMRVLATDLKVLERPLCVEELHRPDAFPTLLPRADIVVSAVPLTKRSCGMIAGAGVRHDEAWRRPDQRVARQGGRHRGPGRRPG